MSDQIILCIYIIETNKTKQNKQTKKILHKKIMIIEPEVSGTQTLTKSYDEK